MDAMLTILTPTYNRGVQLKNLYESLKCQINKNFIWYVVDDGSIDDTKHVIEEFQQESLMTIRYDKKENGGKHTALNYGIKRVETVLTMIVDSDDLLTPDAVETICKDWIENCEQNICGMNYLRGYSEFEVIGKSWIKEEQIGNSITHTWNKGIKGDKAEVFCTEILKQFPFPEFEGEKFLSEACVWIEIAKHYDMFLKNKIIYITQYLEGGLTKSGRKMQLQNPNGAMYNASAYMWKKFSIKIKLKNGILYNCYGKIAGKSIKELWKKSPSKFWSVLGYIPGIFLQKKWMKKFLK